MTTPPLIPLDAQLRRVALASQRLAGEMILLGLAVQIAWFEAWTQPVIDAAEARSAGLAQRSRRDRLMRRGVPAHLAGRALSLVP
ncbi:hypothetical protein FF100_31095 [Methylobacterium terricola]|uniref:Uncharacterized protein n=1 Tax=Methylobacterium terricola TaxID=2583531 RepID=A0A5C4L8G9_9HYPH|nr:hypothetical protein [Methylobacterium terricola]TNC07891.1 hypothetical protein FF100_31095 [Methylobacterium terricola]